MARLATSSIRVKIKSLGVKALEQIINLLMMTTELPFVVLGVTHADPPTEYSFNLEC